MYTEKVMVLGVEYTITFCTPLENTDLSEASGVCNPHTKKIYINTFGVTNSEVDIILLNDTLRHELIHAFLYESGLWADSWADNEEIVDWIALTVPKLNKVLEGAKVEGIDYEDEIPLPLDTILN